MERNAITAFYDRYAERQLAAGVNERHFLIREIVLAHSPEQEPRILEMGCGVGTVSGLLAEAFPKSQVLSVDLSPASIEQARSLYQSVTNLEFRVADVVHDDLGTGFDLIVLPDILEHIPEPLHVQLFKGLKRALSKEGRIVIHSPDPYFSDWLKQNRPELMQVVDIALHLPLLTATIHTAGLTFLHMQRHCIWTDVPDYMALVLVHEPKDHGYTETAPPSTPIWDRVKEAISRHLR